MAPRLSLALIIGLSVMLSACIGGGEVRRADAPVSSTRPSAGHAALPAPSQDTRDCMAQLAAVGVRFTPLPDQEFGGGCDAKGAVRLNDVGTATTNLGPMTCPLARGFATWVRYAVRPAARQVYGQDIARVETFGTYSCRNIYGGRSGRLSEHAHANAVDVAAFVLEGGERVSVLDGWNGDGRARRFLRLIHTSACRRFGTVLSPDYNAAHHNHFHFDMSGQAYCR